MISNGNSKPSARAPAQEGHKAVSNEPVRGFPTASQVPCVELFTEEEAICYLRLDTIEALRNPKETMARYRAMGLLRGTQVSKRIFYRRVELERFLERLTDQNPR